MPFKDYSQIVEPLTLPINGKQYTIAPLTLAQGTKLTEHLDPESTVEPMDDDSFRRFMLGATYDQMEADGVPYDAVDRAVMVALAEWQTHDRTIAESLWETGGDPKALQERALRAAPQDHKPAGTTRRAAATSTKRRASGTGTKTSQNS